MTRRARRELGAALLLVLLGAAGLYLASSREWVQAVVEARPPLPPVQRELTGDQVVGLLRPISLVALAAVAALAATRGLGRVLVGALVILAGVGSVTASLIGLAEGTDEALRANPATGSAATGAQASFTGWWVLAVLAGVLLIAGGSLVAIRGRRWSAMSSRYEAPAARADKPPTRREVAVWEALDRGEDPTADTGERPPRVEG